MVKSKRMDLNMKKTKNMIFNFTNKTFTTRLQKNYMNIEVVRTVLEVLVQLMHVGSLCNQVP